MLFGSGSARKISAIIENAKAGTVSTMRRLPDRMPCARAELTRVLTDAPRETTAGYQVDSTVDFLRDL